LVCRSIMNMTSVTTTTTSTNIDCSVITETSTTLPLLQQQQQQNRRSVVLLEVDTAPSVCDSVHNVPPIDVISQHEHESVLPLSSTKMAATSSSTNTITQVMTTTPKNVVAWLVESNNSEIIQDSTTLYRSSVRHNDDDDQQQQQQQQQPSDHPTVDPSSRQRTIHRYVEQLLCRLRYTKKAVWRRTVKKNDETMQRILQSIHDRRCIWLSLMHRIIIRNYISNNNITTTSLSSMEMWLCRFLLWDHWNATNDIDASLLHHFMLVDHNINSSSFVTLQEQQSTKSNTVIIGDDDITNTSISQKRLAIVVILDSWLDDIAETAIRHNLKNMFVSLLEQIIPNLVAWIISNYDITKKETVLVHDTIQFVYRIFVLTSQQIKMETVVAVPTTLSTNAKDVSANSLVEVLWKHSEALIRLLRIQLDHKRYLEKSRNSDKSQSSWMHPTETILQFNHIKWSKQSIQVRRRCCMAVVLEDWIREYDICCRHQQSHSNADNAPSTHASQIWYACFIAAQSPMELGSFEQTLLPSSLIHRLTVVDIQSALQVANENLLNPRKPDPRMVESPSLPPYRTNRNMTRGILAWLSQRNSHLTSFGRDDVIATSKWLFCEVLTAPNCNVYDEHLVVTTLYVNDAERNFIAT
jgi:hypothetical protein